MRIIHTADLHKDREHFAELEASLDVIEDKARELTVDLIAIPGDLYDGSEQNSERDGHDPFVARIQRLGNIAPVVIVYGTPSHDVPGSLDTLGRLACRHGVTILQAGRPYFLHAEGFVDEDPAEGTALILGVPEPQKKWLLANGGATGKDEADLAVRQAMRGLFLGLGGLRKQYSDLPCVLLYHGQVSGARTGTGYEAGSGIAVSKDDLMAVGADYIAMGDIHFPQQIPGIPAYYPGKAYPGDFREQNYKFGCNLVNIEFEPGFSKSGADGGLFGTPQFVAEVSRIDFPHPVQKKLTERRDRDLVEGCEGYLVWLELTCTRKEAEEIDITEQLALLLEDGALPGSYVTLRYLPEETVRAGEISEKKGLRAKAQVWAENTSLTIPESALIKLDKIELEAAAAGRTGAGAYIRIDRLVLRGAIGIWKKSRKDEIDLNLEALGPGVLALVGPNGAGKTTILENMHPWAGLLTRDGTLKDNFRLRDSFRDLYFTDERTGVKYRALINIKADIDSGTAEYFLFQDTGEGFKAVPGVTGRKDPYEAAITGLFGSLELYLKTAFQTQRASKYSPDLADATKGQRQAIFGELAGLDYLEAHKETCKAQGDSLDTELRILEATIAAGGDIDEVLIKAGEDLAAATADEAREQAEVVHSIERGKTLHAEVDALVLQVQGLAEKAQRRAAICQELAAIADEIQAAEAEIVRYREAAAEKESAEKEVNQVTSLETEATGLRAEKAELDGQDKKALLAHQESVRLITEQRQVIQAELDRRRQAWSAVERDLALARAKIAIEAKTIRDQVLAEIQQLGEQKAAGSWDVDGLTESLQTARQRHAELMALHTLAAELTPGCACPLCGSDDHPAPAPSDEVPNPSVFEGIADQLDHKTSALRTIERTLLARETELAALDLRIKESDEAEARVKVLEEEKASAMAMVYASEQTLEAAILPPPPEPSPFAGETRLHEIERVLEWLDRAAAEKTLQAAREAVVRIEEGERRISAATARRAPLDLEAEKIELELSTQQAPTKAALESKKAELLAEQEAYTNARSAVEGAKARAESARQAIEAATKRKAGLEEASRKRDETALERDDWRLLERALGKNGVQALELDALAPSIVAVSNALLAEAYGSRYQLEIRTQRTAGKGKDTKQVEDFEIFVLDTESGDEQEIATLSGGEAVWIRKALYDGFAIIRARNTGTKFQTVFLDEADGALDPEARKLYLRMLEAAHRESGRFQTIIITHSKEIQAMVERIVDIAALEPRKDVA